MRPLFRLSHRRGVASRLAALALAVAAIAGCGLPTDDDAQAIDPDELPESLRPGFTASTTTTIPAPLTVSRIVYLLTNPQDIERTVVVEVERQVDRNATLGDVLATLFGEATSAEESDAGYFNTLELFEILSATVIDGVATVDIVNLSPEGEDQPPSADELEFAAAPAGVHRHRHRGCGRGPDPARRRGGVCPHQRRRRRARVGVANQRLRAVPARLRPDHHHVAHR